MLRQQLHREYGLELGGGADAGLHSLVEKVRPSMSLLSWLCIVVALQAAESWQPLRGLHATAVQEG